MKNIAIIGAGGHTRSSINLLQKNYQKNIYDNSFSSKKEEYIHAIKIQGTIDDIRESSLVFLSIGDNKERAFYFKKFKKQILEENLFHETSFCENNIKLGIANQIFSNVYINSYVKIGDNNIINSSTILEHEVELGNHNHIAVNVNICGRVKIKNSCFIGAGSTIIDKISICDDVIIGAGSVVIKNITKRGTYVGNPIRKIK